MTDQPKKFPPFDEHPEQTWGAKGEQDTIRLTRDEYTELREAWLAEEEYKKHAETVIDDLERHCEVERLRADVDRLERVKASLLETMARKPASAQEADDDK